MNSLSVTLETLTPLFLGGVEPREDPPELRAPSIRGVLRYWLRAALGGVLGDQNLEQLRQAETAVFGNTDHGSAVVTRVVPLTTPLPIESFTKQQSIRGGKLPKPTGRDYLLWSMASTGNRERGNFQPARQYIKPGAQFELQLIARAGVPARDANERLFEATAALWLLVHLGGLGSRSRRAAGSLGVVKVRDEFSFPAWSEFKTPSELQDALQKTIAMIRERFARNHPTAPLHAPTQFDVLHPSACQIWILADRTPWTTWEQAVEGIGARLRDFRSYREPDHQSVRQWIEKGKRPETVERVAFGLPLPFRYSGGGPSDVLQGSSPKRDRRTSPLALRVSKLSARQYVGVAVLFHSRFLPQGEELMLVRARRQTAPPPNYALVQKFVEEFPQCLEVKL